MKFTEEQAREALRAELTNKGRKTLHMSDRTLAKQTEILMKKLATEDTGLPDFVADVIDIFNEIEGDARKKDSDFAKYKELHPDEPKPGPTDEPKPTPPAENPELKAALERIAALEKLNEENNKKVTAAQRRKDVESKLREKGVDNDEWIEMILEDVDFTKEIDIDAKTEKWLKGYNLSKANSGSPVPPKNTNGGAPSNPYADSVKAAAQLAKQERAVFEPKKTE